MIEKTTHAVISGNRDVSISILRLMAMLLIILCHMTSYYGNEISRWLNVGVQVFFIISGFLYGTKIIDSPIVFLCRNTKKILIPYWLFLIIAIVAYAFVCPVELSYVSILKAFFCAGTIKGLGHLWFVGYILFCYVLTPYLYWLRIHLAKTPFKKKIVIYISILIIFQVVSFFLRSYFDPDRVSCYIIGFFLADLFKDAPHKRYTFMKWSLIFLTILMCCAEIYIKYLSCIKFIGWQDTLFRIFCRYSHMFLGILFFLLVYGQFSNYQYNVVLRLSDKYSYSIYIVHQLFILSPLSLMAITGNEMLSWVVVIICILLSGFILNHTSGWIDDKFFRTPTFSHN